MRRPVYLNQAVCRLQRRRKEAVGAVTFFATLPVYSTFFVECKPIV
jgi:hypothetical protein